VFLACTVRRLSGAVAGGFPRRFGARPDLESGRRLVAVATAGGIVAALSGPPPAGGPPATRLPSRLRSPGPGVEVDVSPDAV
jgi:hypothetical protein